MTHCANEIRELLLKRKRISEFLYKHADELSAIRQKTKILPSTDWVLGFAENITPTLRAPNGWVPGRPLHDLGGHPPAPQLEQMRLGLLGQLHQSRLANPILVSAAKLKPEDFMVLSERAEDDSSGAGLYGMNSTTATTTTTTAATATTTTTATSSSSNINSNNNNNNNNNSSSSSSSISHSISNSGSSSSSSSSSSIGGQEPPKAFLESEAEIKVEVAPAEFESKRRQVNINFGFGGYSDDSDEGEEDEED